MPRERRLRFCRIILVIWACGVNLRSLHAYDIAFFYALDADCQALKKDSSVVRSPIVVGGHSIQVFGLGQHKIYATKMGSGAVETATSAEALLARFRCDLGISLGPVGILSDEIAVGKWYKVNSVIPYQKGSWTRGGFQIKNGSIMSRSEEGLPQKLLLPALFQGVKNISIASGEAFVVSSDYRQQLRETTHADAVDMNLFGLLSVCSEYRLPILNWRIGSDKADDKAGDDFRNFIQKYDALGGKAVAELIRNLPANPNSPESYPELQKLLKKSVPKDRQ